MEIRLCCDEKGWHASEQFLQSWEWGEFQRAVGNMPMHLQAVENGNVVGQWQGFIHQLPFGMRYGYFPRVSDQRSAISDQMIEYLFKEYSFIFLRLEPVNIFNLQSPISNLQSPTSNIQPRDTLILNISQSEQELLAAMHEKTRYNIRLAERKGVVVEQKKDVDIFWLLNQETTQRDGFKSHGRGYYERMLAMTSCIQLIARYENEPIASIILIHHGDTMTYLHGASSDTHRSLMAPYALQWDGIRIAKSLGAQHYDFWGIAPSGDFCFHELCWDACHPWSGITRFKAGFGGAVHTYPEAIDVVLRPWQYRWYRAAQKIKRRIREII